MSIGFYVVDDPYGWLCNFSPHGFEVDGVYWPTVEHFFQAQKFAGTPHEEQMERIRALRRVKDTKRMGHDRRLAIRPDWDDAKVDVMRLAVRRKFETHDDLRAQLLATGDEELVETAPSDWFWGCGADGTGENRLGKILMELRDELRAGSG